MVSHNYFQEDQKNSGANPWNQLNSIHCVTSYPNSSGQKSFKNKMDEYEKKMEGAQSALFRKTEQT